MKFNTNTESMVNINDISDIISCDNDLEYDVFKDIFLGECECYNTIEDIINGIDNGDFNPECGCVGGLVYYEQTSNIFKNYFDEILEVANNYQQESGEILELDVNTLVWFTWNETVNKWYNEILDYLQ